MFCPEFVKYKPFPSHRNSSIRDALHDAIAPRPQLSAIRLDRFVIRPLRCIRMLSIPRPIAFRSLPFFYLIFLPNLCRGVCDYQMPPVVCGLGHLNCAPGGRGEPLSVLVQWVRGFGCDVDFGYIGFQ